MVCQGSGFGGLPGWVQDHWRRRARLATRDKGRSKAKKSESEREEQSKRDKKRHLKEKEEKRLRAARAERAEVDRQEVRAGKEREMWALGSNPGKEELSRAVHRAAIRYREMTGIEVPDWAQIKLFAKVLARRKRQGL
jgi:hypothetical protein